MLVSLIVTSYNYGRYIGDCLKSVAEQEGVTFEHLVMDVNGTLAVDGQLLDGVAEKVVSLRNRLTIHLLTADTHGKQAVIDRQY